MFAGSFFGPWNGATVHLPSVACPALERLNAAERGGLPGVVAGLTKLAEVWRGWWLQSPGMGA